MPKGPTGLVNAIPAVAVVPEPVKAPPARLFWQTTDGVTARAYLGNVTDALALLPERSVHTCVTSPPYWGLRRYLFDGAVILRDDLTESERQHVMSELAKHGVNSE